MRGGLFLPASAVAAALMIAVGIAAGVRAASPSAEDKQPIEGVWEGRYWCGQGTTAVTLTIEVVPPSLGIQYYIHHQLSRLLTGKDVAVPARRRPQIQAVFSFHPLEENPQVPSGSFELTGGFDPALGLLQLYPTKWIEQPEGYIMLGLRALLAGDGKSLRGAINEANCGVILLTRAGVGGAAPEAPPSPDKSAPVQTTPDPDLAKLNEEIFQLFQAGDYARSLKVAEQALALAEERYGPDHPIVAGELRFLAQVLRSAGRNDEAEAAVRRALAIDEKALSPEDFAIAYDLKILMLLLVDESLKQNEPAAGENTNVVALTGQLPKILEQAVPLALIASLILLWIYTRAVKRSMGRRADRAAEEAAVATPPASVSAKPLEILTIDGASASGAAPSDVEARALSGPWRSAAIYCFAGLCYVLTVTSASLYSAGLEFLPGRFALIAVAYAWPMVLTVGLVAALTWRGWAAAASVYFLVFAAVTVVGMLRSDAFTWDQGVRMFLLTNLPGTFLILAFLPRPIRAVGPLVLVLMVAAVAGTNLWHNVYEMAGPQVLMPVVDLFEALGFDAFAAVDAATIAIEVLGALLLALIGWLCLRGVGRLYRARLISDQSVIIDSLWFLFALTAAVDFTFSGLAWFLAPLGAFVVFKIVAALGFAIFKEKPLPKGDPKLLLLRVFSLGKRSARLFNAFGKLWRHAGSIRLIAGPDLATSTVEPHEFLDFLSGKLGRAFISGPDMLAQRLAETKQARDFDGRYRVDDFFCHADTWQMVLRRLARESDAVLMDLRGFLPENQGCIFEINELLNVVPLDCVVFVIDDTTDLKFLQETLEQGWAALAANSPNRKLAEAKALLFRFTGKQSVLALLKVVAEAARGEGEQAQPHADAFAPVPAAVT